VSHNATRALLCAGALLAAAVPAAVAQTTMLAPSEVEACLTLPAGARVVYPDAALERREVGTVRVWMAFSAAHEAPSVSAELTHAVEAQVDAVLEHVRKYRVPCLRRWAKALHVAQNTRMPCLEGEPRENLAIHRFHVDGEPWPELRNTNLQGFLASAKRLPEGVYFDLDSMGCPFDLRLTYWQPHMSNAIKEIGREMPARRAFIDWLASIEMRLQGAEANQVLGTDIKISVPCGTVNL
jgi:phage tail protein X